MKSGVLASLLVILTLLVAPPAVAAPIELVILHVNDWDKLDGVDGAGGAARIVSTVGRERADAVARGAATLTTFGGDMISPSLLSGFDKGAHMIALANRVGFDAAVFGNHEFDFGPRALAPRLKESNFPWIASNISTRGEPGFPGAARTMVLDRGGVRIGLIGLTTPETAVASSPGPNLAFEEPVEAALRLVPELLEQGAEIVIALTHQDLARDRALLAAVPQIDIVLGGHDHLGVAFYDGRDVILKAGAQGGHVGRLSVSLERIEGRDGSRIVWRPAMALLDTRAVAPEPATAAEVDRLLASLDAELDRPIGVTSVELDTRRAAVRGGETLFGNLVADAMREATESDIAVTNGGGIRGDAIYPAGTELTRRTVLTELPFGNKTVKLRVSGDTVRAALEHAVSGVEDGAGRFLQVSGLHFAYDPTAPVGERVREVTVAGRALDVDARYTLATNDFLAAGGDGYTMLTDATRIIDAASARLLTAQVIATIEARGGISGAPQGRIRRLE